MKYNYSTIKKLPGKIENYIALARENDPFYVGSPAQLAGAQWFTNIFNREKFAAGVHLRRIHYRIAVSMQEKRPNGEIYQNNKTDWSYLVKMAKYARYLGLINVDLIEDNRSPDPIINFEANNNLTPVEISNSESHEDFYLPELPEPPEYNIYSVTSQPCQIEIWCEKSTMDEILLPLCRKYKLNFVDTKGHASITHVVKLVERAKQNNKPARILYISDNDPAGKSMPVGTARKIEFFIQEKQVQEHISLEQIVLTEDQVKQYNLPKSFDTEATELDALEALHPGELKKIVEKAILKYYSTEAEEAADNLWDDIYDTCDNIRNEILTENAIELNKIKQMYGEMKAEMEQKMNQIKKRSDELYENIAIEMQNRTPDFSHEISEYQKFVNSRNVSHENENVLFSSERDYMEQMKYYKEYQNGNE
jgi:hypothetical protein